MLVFPPPIPELLGGHLPFYLLQCLTELEAYTV